MCKNLRITAGPLQPYISHCLAVFGPGRCMFGSDWPVCRLAQPFADYSRTMKLMVGTLQHTAPILYYIF